MTDDPHHLARFVDAQHDTYETALAELRAGAKRSHWMWFVFPQIEGLGHSAMARAYAIRSAEEARAYLATRCWGRGCGHAWMRSRHWRRERAPSG